MFDNIGNIIKNSIEKAEDMLTLKPLRKKLEEESEVFRNVGNVARTVDSAIGPKRLFDFAENPSIEKIGNSISKGKDLFLEGFNEEKKREEEEKASYRELFKPSTFLPPTPGLPKPEDIAEKVSRQRDNADAFLQGFKEASKDFSWEGIKDAAKTNTSSQKPSIKDTLNSAMNIFEDLVDTGKSNINTAVNNTGSWLNKNGVLDDLTNEFFKRYGRDQEFPIKVLPTGIAHKIVSEKNYNENKKVDLSSYDKDKGYIDNQRSGEVGKIKYGFDTLDKNGCGIIAVNNALISLGNRKDIRDIAREFENDGQVLFGAFGTNPYDIGDYFIENGYHVDTYESGDLFSALKNSDANTYIFTYWNSDKVEDGAHIVSIDKLEDGSYRFYNMGCKDPLPEKDAKELFNGGSKVHLMLHCIKKGR